MNKIENSKLQMNYGLIIDVETTGRDLLKNDMICFAAVIIDFNTGKFHDEFKVFLKPKSGKLNWEKRCVDEFWEKKENKENTKITLLNFEKYGVSIEFGMKQFFDWINIKQPKEVLNNLMIYTDTAGFDISWVNRYLSEADLGTDCCYIIQDQYRPTRDCTSYNFGIARHLPSNGLWGSEKQAAKILNFENPENFKEQSPFKHDHDPLNDARYIAYSIYRLCYLGK